MVLHREIVRCMRLNPDNGVYECEKVCKPDDEDLSALYDFVDAYKVKEIVHISRTYRNGVAVDTVFRDLFQARCRGQ